MHAAFSPDGHWVSYVSVDPGGEPQVFVQSFPEGGAKFQISNGSADSPCWSADGNELFYLTGDKRIMAVPIEKGHTLRAGVPRALFQVPVMRAFVSGHGFRTQFGVSKNGQRILVNTMQEESVHVPITVVANWTAESKGRLEHLELAQ
jgi:eukaryotic-like serine/threonine-protein kinase